jgi:hypothetical protein
LEFELKDKTKTGDLDNLKEMKNLNPFFQVIFVRMCFTSWLRYAQIIKDR